MNKEELKAFVEADRKKVEEIEINKLKEKFHSILKVYPDTINPKKVAIPGKYSYYSDSVQAYGYECTLDGATFYLEKRFYRDYESVFLYQAIVTAVKTVKKRFLRKDTISTTEKVSLVNINRPADIVI